MAEVVISRSAQEDFNVLPLSMQGRVRNVLARLEHWPAVSGVKPLRGGLAGSCRIRTGDYRVVFRVQGRTVTVWRIGYRGGVYD